jgi:hypothetical protein
MNYSHILTIQVWSEKNNQTTNHGNILNRIKELIVEGIQSQELLVNDKKKVISLLWKQIKWSSSNNNLYNSDIVTERHFIKDEIIYQHTKQMLDEIEEKLSIENKFTSDYKIIFSIVKPLHQKNELLENINLEFAEI